MEIVRKIPVTLDFRQVTKIPMPQINQFDSNVFEFTIVDNGEAADLSNVERVVGNYRRPDKTVVSRTLTHAANVIEYPLGAEEMAQQGMGELNVQLFDASKRLSSVTIKVYLHDNLGADLETSEGMTLLQEIFVEVSDLAVEAQSAATYAKNQGDYAKEQAEKAGDLEGVKNEVVAAATEAEAQATFAKTQGDYAKEQADLSAEQYERLKDTDVGSLSAQLADTAKLPSLNLKLSNTRYSNGNGILVLEMSPSGVIYASKQKSELVRSLDNGQTYQSVYLFENQIETVKVLSNGNLLASIKGLDGGSVWVSNATHTQFTKKFDCSKNSRVVNWGFSQHENIIALCEYGNQGLAVKAYLSDDGGNSFRVIFDLSKYAGTPQSCHTHGIVYDQFFKRLWVMTGDGFLEGNTKIYYSDDMGSTWDSFLPQAQMLNGYAFEDRVIFFTDAAPNGVYTYERNNKYEKPYLKLVKLFEGVPVSGVSYLCMMTYRKTESHPLICSFMNGDVPGEVATKPNFIWGTYDGLNFFEVWKDTLNHAPVNPVTAIAPTNNDKLLSSFAGDGRFTNPTILTGDVSIKKDLNVFSDVKLSDKFLNIKEFGITGQLVQDRELYIALKTASEINKTLYIPSDLTILVQRTQVKDLNGIKMVCEGTIKIIELETGNYAEALEFVNCTNIDITTINIDCNVRNTLSPKSNNQNFHKALSFVGCNNVRVGNVNIRNLSGLGVIIKDSNNVRIDDVKGLGNDTGRSVLDIKNSSDVLIVKTLIENCGTIAGNHNVIDIQSSTNEKNSNISIKEAVVNNNSNGGIIISNKGGICSNVELNCNIKKGLLFNGYSDIVKLEGIEKVRGNISVETSHVDMAVAPPNIYGASLDGLSNFKLNFDLTNIRKGAKVGVASDIDGGVITGEFKKIYESAIVMGGVKNTVFNLNTNDANKSNLALAVIQASGSTQYVNVTFEKCLFRKGTSTKDCVNFLNKQITNMIFKDCDFTDWEFAKQLNHELGGLKRVNNLGMNWNDSQPTSLYQGYWMKGDTIFNSNPAPGGYMGWVCVTSGRPGTWKGFGLIVS